jgi:hypothetical protein
MMPEYCEDWMFGGGGVGAGVTKPLTMPLITELIVGI